MPLEGDRQGRSVPVSRVVALHREPGYRNLRPTDCWTTPSARWGSVAATNVDWPVDLVFWGNASISKVYNKINWSWSGSTEYEQLNDGSGNVWVSSGGRKNTICTDTHYRIYAPSAGYLSNTILGHYVIGTAHLDKNECFGSSSYGWNETAEAHVAARAATVWGSAAVVKNAMFMPDGTPTFLLFQNAQTGWQGNHYFNNNGYPTLIHVP